MSLRFLSITLLIFTFSISGIAQDELSVSFEPAKYPIKRKDFLQLSTNNPSDQPEEVKIRLEVKDPSDNILYSWLVPAYVIPTGTQNVNMNGAANMTFTTDRLDAAKDQDKLSVFVTTTVSGQYGYSEKTSIYRFPVQAFDFDSRFPDDNTSVAAKQGTTERVEPEETAPAPVPTNTIIPNQIADESPVDASPAPSSRVAADANLLALPERMNVFYLGVENPLFVSGADAFTSVSCNQPGIGIRAGSKTGQFIINVSIPGEYTLTIDNGTVSSQQSFSARRIPDPVASLGDTSGGNIGPVQLKEGIGVILYLRYFNFDAKCQATGFIVWRIQADGTRNSVNNKGPRFSAETKALIELATPGDIYIFENIRGKCPGDVAHRRLSGMTFFVK